MAYADPPYPGLAKRYYGDQPSYAGEVDHKVLLASLEPYDGWALSTSERALRQILPLCPERARVLPWCKPIGVPPATYGLHNTWEPLIVVPGRELRPGKRDWLSAQPARYGGDLPGRKPSRFVAFLFDALGILPGDLFDDLFPGTGIVGRAWTMVSSGLSLEYSDDEPSSSSPDNGCPSGDVASPRTSSDGAPSFGADANVSPSPGRDESSAAVSNGCPAPAAARSSSRAARDASSTQTGDA